MTRLEDLIGDVNDGDVDDKKDPILTAIIASGENITKESDAGPVGDAGLIATAQKVADSKTQSRGEASGSDSGRCALQSVNVSGELRHIQFGGNFVMTGFFKAPVTAQSTVHRFGIEGDAQGDLTAHGGLDKAVYCYPSEHYPVWEDLLQRGALPPGSFAENLTTSGLTEEGLCIGDVLVVGSVVLQVTQPRSPCYKLQIKFERNDMVALFVQFARVVYGGPSRGLAEAGRYHPSHERSCRKNQRCGSMALQPRSRTKHRRPETDP